MRLWLLIAICSFSIIISIQAHTDVHYGKLEQLISRIKRQSSETPANEENKPNEAPKESAAANRADKSEAAGPGGGTNPQPGKLEELISQFKRQASETSASDAIKPSEDTKEIANREKTGAESTPAPAPAPGPGPGPGPKPKPGEKKKEEGGGVSFVVVFIIIAVIALAAVGGYYGYKYMKKRPSGGQQSSGA